MEGSASESLCSRKAENLRAAISSFLKGLLDERDYNILKRRYGFEGTRTQTFKAISEEYGLSRARIQQIQRRAIDLCQTDSHQDIFRQFLKIRHNSILATLFDGAVFVPSDNAVARLRTMPGLEKLSLDILYGNVESWLTKNLEPVQCAENVVGWLMPGLGNIERNNLRKWAAERNRQTGNIRKRIKCSIRSSPWPVTIAYLCAQMPDYSPAKLAKYLHREFNAKIKDGVIKYIEKLPSSTRLILVLREARRALHLRAIRAAHRRLFGSDMSEHAAGAVLQRLEEVLIVERGTYDLYENLSLDAATVQKIRDLAVARLDETGHFLSAKLLRRKIISDLPAEVAHYLTPYMVHGICQDDSRFAIHRGLMIGLSRKNFEKSFSSLTDSIHHIVRKSGPVSLAEIKSKMSHERLVRDVSVHGVLKNSNEIVAAGDGTYDLIGKIIGDDEAIERLSYAIEIALIDTSISFPVLATRLAAVGYTFSDMTILSFLRNSQDAVRVDDLFSLIHPSNAVRNYNDTFHRTYDAHKSTAQNRGALRHALVGSSIHKLTNLDFRLAMEPMAWNTEHPGANNDTDFLDKMMAEFDF